MPEHDISSGDPLNEITGTVSYEEPIWLLEVSSILESLIFILIIFLPSHLINEDLSIAFTSSLEFTTNSLVKSFGNNLEVSGNASSNSLVSIIELPKEKFM